MTLEGSDNFNHNYNVGENVSDHPNLLSMLPLYVHRCGTGIFCSHNYSIVRPETEPETLGHSKSMEFLIEGATWDLSSPHPFPFPSTTTEDPREQAVVPCESGLMRHKIFEDAWEEKWDPCATSYGTSLTKTLGDIMQDVEDAQQTTTGVRMNTNAEKVSIHEAAETVSVHGDPIARTRDKSLQFSFIFENKEVRFPTPIMLHFRKLFGIKYALAPLLTIF
jgi:hypothetical protein